MSEMAQLSRDEMEVLDMSFGLRPGMGLDEIRQAMCKNRHTGCGGPGYQIEGADGGAHLLIGRTKYTPGQVQQLLNSQGGAPSTRSLPQIEASIALHKEDVVRGFLGIGQDLLDAKKQLNRHGAWMEWLAKMGFHQSAANKYMKLAAEIQPGTFLAALPYSKALALLSLPEEEREDFAREHQDDSAAEIKRLIRELKKAQEAREKAEDELEELGKMSADTIDDLREKLVVSEAKIRENERTIRESEAKLHERAKNPEIVEKIVEKIPDDYELIKRQLRLAEDAAEDAERRAAEAVQQAQEAMAGEADSYEGPNAISFISSVNRFMAEASQLPYAGEWLRGLNREDRKNVKLFTDTIWHWAEQMEKAIDQADRVLVFPAEGAVVSE